MATLNRIWFDHLNSGRSLEHESASSLPAFTPTEEQTDVLTMTEFGSDDIEEWTKIALAPDSLDSATMLAERTRSRGAWSVPIFALIEFLSREYVSARALRVFVAHAEEIIQARRERERFVDKSLMVVFMRMTYHARKVWPAVLSRSTGILLDNMPPVKHEDSVPDFEKLRDLTRKLNSAMHAVVVPTAIHPIKNTVHQEAALVRILQYMNDHTPTLQITRRGYRAVVRLQLAQRKTEKEQEWAKIKALSWPPWKEERTAMDRFITADDHGTSKAAATLLRMREAGYTPLQWEETAMIYAGWDVDRTPTVQTLTLLGMDGDRFKSGTAKWSGRVAATRTAQEAWAAFLAYENEVQNDSFKPEDQEVHLAMLEKLHKEDVRGRNKIERNARAKNRSIPLRPLLPGDVREVWPLPPSTHLHTYTRIAVPTMHRFYEHMVRSDNMPQGHVLAYVVAHADTIGRGLQYLRECDSTGELAGSLLLSDPSVDRDRLPLPVVTAFIQLLCRFSKVPMSGVGHGIGTGVALESAPRIFPTRSVGHIAIAHAIAILQSLRPHSLSPYNAVLKALGHESSHGNLMSVDRPYMGPFFNQLEKSKSIEDRSLQTHQGAITALRLGRRVLNFVRDNNLDLDVDGLLAFAHVTENAAFSTWCIMLEAEKGRISRNAIEEAILWVRSRGYNNRLRVEFRNLVGDDLEFPTTALEIPSFAVLHVYVRALGWMADHEGLLETVRWMHAHAVELTARREQDRNGDILMHRTFCALRVFLERSWLSQQRRYGQEELESHDEGQDASAAADRDSQHTQSLLFSPISPVLPARLGRHLSQLRTPASQEMIDEVRGMVESVDHWRGWPDEEEVTSYCQQSSTKFSQAM